MKLNQYFTGAFLPLNHLSGLKNLASSNLTQVLVLLYIKYGNNYIAFDVSHLLVLRLEVEGNAMKRNLGKNFEQYNDGCCSIIWRAMVLLNVNVTVSKKNRHTSIMEAIQKQHFNQLPTTNHLDVMIGAGYYSVAVNAGAGSDLGFITTKSHIQGKIKIISQYSMKIAIIKEPCCLKNTQN